MYISSGNPLPEDISKDRLGQLNSLSIVSISSSSEPSYRMTGVREESCDLLKVLKKEGRREEDTISLTEEI